MLAAMVVGYQVHAWLATHVGISGAHPAAVPEGLLLATLQHTAAAVVSGYLAAVIAGRASLRVGRLLGVALAAIAGLAAFQRFEQGLPLLTMHVAQVVASPACLLGAMLLERHRAVHRWVRPAGRDEGRRVL